MDDTRTRYVRLVDGEPVSLSFTEAGDVPGSIEVGVKFKSTGSTLVSESVAGLLINGPASGALLTGVPCVDVEHGLPDVLGLVINEPLKLAERPVAECSIELLSQFLPSSDAELFQRYRIIRLGHYPVGYPMVHIGHEAFLLLRQTLQFTFGGAGAFGLELSTKVQIAAFDRTDVIGIIEPVVREDGMVEYSGIDPDDRGRRPDARCSFLHHYAEHELGPVERQLGRYGLPADILPEVFRDAHVQLDPPGHAGQRDESFAKLGCEGPLIVSDGGPLPLDREPFQLLPLKHLGGIVPCGADEGGRDAWITLSGRIIGQVMQLELIDDPCMESDDKNFISGGIDRLYRINQTLVSADMQGDCTLHKSSLDNMVYLKIAPIPPTFEKVGFLGGVL